VLESGLFGTQCGELCLDVLLQRDCDATVPRGQVREATRLVLRMAEDAGTLIGPL
jgi:hypothetical protein